MHLEQDIQNANSEVLSYLVLILWIWVKHQVMEIMLVKFIMSLEAED